MTCRDVKQFLKREGRQDHSLADHDALALHLRSCRRCREVMQVARLSSALFGTLREEIRPGPSFYPRLQARLADLEISRPDTTLLHAWGFARRLIPALAMGVLLLAGVTLSVGGSRSSLPIQARGGRDVYVFSLEEVDLPGVVGRPSRDQMLAFVLTERAGPAPGTDPGCDARGAQCNDTDSGFGR